MINKKKDLSEEEKKDILDTLDIIDISIYDLLVKRKELKAELENSKKIVYNQYCSSRAAYVLAYGWIGPVRRDTANHVRRGTEQH